MTPTQALIAGLFVAFACGVYVGRDQREPAPSAMPSNMDVASALTAEKAAKTETAAYRELVVKALDGCRPMQETH